MLEAIFAAAAAPLTMTMGFFIWGDHWHGSAYALNLFKCTLASSLFFIVALCIRVEFLDILTSNPLTICLPLIISSIIGILIGDNAWLISLQIIGARRVIFVDGLKPFIAAACGTLFLNEPFTFVTAIGLFLSSVGIVLVCFETNSNSSIDEKPTELPVAETMEIEPRGDIELVPSSLDILNTDTNNNVIDVNEMDLEMFEKTNNVTREEGTNEVPEVSEGRISWMFVYGHFLAGFNVIFDVYGSVLTKQSAKSLNTWEINWIRFGFAAFVMICSSGALWIMNTWSLSSSSLKWGSLSQNHGNEKEKTEISKGTELTTTSSTTTDIDISNATTVGMTSPWYSLPIHEYEMDSLSWKYAATGVLFVTFLTPAMSQYALFRLDLGVALTLNALGPIYSLMLSVLLHQLHLNSGGEDQDVPAKYKLTKRVICGTIIAFIGVVVLCTE